MYGAISALSTSICLDKVMFLTSQAGGLIRLKIEKWDWLDLGRSKERKGNFSEVFLTLEYNDNRMVIILGLGENL